MISNSTLTLPYSVRHYGYLRQEHSKLANLAKFVLGVDIRRCRSLHFTCNALGSKRVQGLKIS